MKLEVITVISVVFMMVGAFIFGYLCRGVQEDERIRVLCAAVAEVYGTSNPHLANDLLDMYTVGKTENEIRSMVRAALDK